MTKLDVSLVRCVYICINIICYTNFITAYVDVSWMQFKYSLKDRIKSPAQRDAQAHAT